MLGELFFTVTITFNRIRHLFEEGERLSVATMFPGKQRCFRRWVDAAHLAISSLAVRQPLAILTLTLVALASPRSEGACRSGRELPAATHGLYLPVPLSSQRKLPAMVDLALRSGVNTLVVDVKDASGRVSLKEAAAIPLVTMHSEADLIDMQGLQAFRKKTGGWLIARITMFLDPCLAVKRTDFAIKRPDGTLYDEGGAGSCGRDTFTSPYLGEVWALHIAIAKKALAAGFDEIQLDYVRFPDQPLDALVPPKADWDKASRIETITLGVARVRAELPRNAVLSVDVFGRTVEENDPVIGQDVRLLAPYIDYLSPMLYPSLWTAGSFGIPRPVAAPYKTIFASLKSLRDWMRYTPCPPRVRPWFQTGDWPEMPYGREETQAQIEAAAAWKVRDWMLWQFDGEYDPEAIRARKP
jgi:hypothetical protein